MKHTKELVIFGLLFCSYANASDASGFIFLFIMDLLFNVFVIGLIGSVLVLLVYFAVFRNALTSPNKLYKVLRGVFIALQLPWLLMSVSASTIMISSVVTSPSDIDLPLFFKFSGSVVAFFLVNFLIQKILYPKVKSNDKF